MDPTQRSAANSAVHMVRALWGRGGPGAPPPRIREVVEALRRCDGEVMVEGLVADAEERWERGVAGTLDVYLGEVGEVVSGEEGAEARRAILMCEVARRRETTLEELGAELAGRYPEMREEVEAVVGLAALVRPLGEETEERDGLAEGEMVGKYVLVRQLGAGAFGEVWQARDVELHRYVALKLLFARPDAPAGEERASRFIAEARAAAALEHEHLVSVHDAGVVETANGERRWYIDSQLVGDPAPTAEDPIRVEVGRSLEGGLGEDVTGARRARAAAVIVESVARAIAAAHARGVLHRDLKPANILITPSGRALVADFGLSVSGQVRGEDGAGAGRGETLRTMDGVDASGARIVGTPAYMSPEQARGEQATPLTDVFALGAVLRYLLTGRPVYEPSGRFSGDARTDVIAQARGAELEPVREGNPEVPRTLGAIVDRAMAGAPGERYVSAEQMAADLRAWLEHRPTIARRPGRTGAAWLWYRRNAAAATVGVVALVVIGAGTVRFIHGLQYERDQARQARTEAEAKRIEAEQARDTTAAVNQFMQESMFLAVSSRPGERVGFEDMIASAERRVGPTLGGRPLIEAEVRQMLGVSLHGFGHTDGARRQLERALALRMEHLGAEAPETVRTRVAAARLDAHERLHEKAEPELVRLIPLCERVLGKEAPETILAMRTLGRVRLSQNRREESESLLKDAAERAERALGRADRRTLDAMSDLLATVGMSGDHERTIALARRIVEGYVTIYGEDDPGTLAQRAGLGYALRRARRAEEAAGEYRRAYEGFVRASGVKNNGTINAGLQLAEVLTDELGRPGEGLEVARSVAVGNPNPVDFSLGWMPQMVLARSQMGTGDEAGAIETARGLFERASEKSRPAGMAAARLLAMLHEKRGESGEAERYRRWMRERPEGGSGSGAVGGRK